MRGETCHSARALAGWLDAIPASRRWAWILLLVNAFGTAYGFWWYHEQLAVAPLYLWPLVPDSPLATMYFALFLASLLRRWPAGDALRSPRPGVAVPPRPWLAALACLANLKYGLWTPLVMAHFWAVTGQATFESVHLSLSHLGMALQGFLYLRRYRTGLATGLAAAAWLFFNDYMDYVRGLHPFLPVPEATGWAGGSAVALSALALVVLLLHERI